MQPNIHNDLLYLLRILEASKKIQLYASGFTNEEEFYFSNDQLEFNACLNQLALIGEQAKKLSNTLTDKYTLIPWSNIKGFRNRVIHEYIGINIHHVFSIIQMDIPDLQNKLIPIISEELNNRNFDREEFEIAKTSPYLRHVDFGVFH